MSLVIQGVNVYLTDCGSGSPILFLHGAPDSAEMWSGAIEQLKDQHRCFAPDLPGFGRSPAPADFTCSLENMARFLDEFIEDYRWRDRRICAIQFSGHRCDSMKSTHISSLDTWSETYQHRMLLFDANR